MDIRQNLDKTNIGNGSLTLPAVYRGLVPSVRVYGGPLGKFPINMAGVCLKEEPPIWYDPKEDHDVALLPIPDFGVPSDAADVEKAILHVWFYTVSKVDVYVGCMGGFGRTGLFLALLAKTAGVTNPIMFVRENYNRHAVETDEQEAYVANFDVSNVRRKLFWVGVRRFLPRMFNSGR